ncbi:MAG: hypothetical protein KGH88_05215 [Thaumarchaeota archaeon]|nr:hypothetical protein [Nitrososphaerota archaeon]
MIGIFHFMYIVLSIVSSSVYSDAQAYVISATGDSSEIVSPITIYKDPASLMVRISINAPDFNSNPYAIDAIGNDPENKIVVSTREGSIPYKLVETGPNTGIFTGYVILSGTTSICSPVCGPTDGLLAASGDDVITVSFTYAQGRTITATLASEQGKIMNAQVPEFGSLAGLVITVSIIAVLVFSRRLVTN